MQDVAAKILSFSVKGSRGICVLAANGAVSNVTIRQPGTSGGLLTYEVYIGHYPFRFVSSKLCKAVTLDLYRSGKTFDIIFSFFSV